MTFSEVRQYQYGDDIRAMIGMCAPLQRSTCKSFFEEERELTMMLMVDMDGKFWF
jgi:uncharacterized protein (DUF58 family)